jgi:dTDP-4-amino-4,6-dideoxygalactose transaminase
MIPRFQSSLGWGEALAAGAWWRAGVEEFEAEFARRLGARFAVSFAYGRMGLLGILEALGLRDREIVVPAYSCVVVAHAVVRSGNRPRFVDVAPGDFNMDLDQVAAGLSPRTGAVVATSMYGYPVDLDRVRVLARRGLPVIQDCALAFGASWQGRPVAREGIAAFYSLNLSKQITALYGGVVTTDDEALYRALRRYQARAIRRPGYARAMSRMLYLVVQAAGFSRRGYPLTDWLANHTRLLDPWTRYYDPGRIELPRDAFEAMPDVQARIGLVQLGRLESILERRRTIARRYDEGLRNASAVRLPPLVDGATYSHYTVAVPDRARFAATMRGHGVEVGRLFDYVIPDLPAYRDMAGGEYPNARRLAREVANLPCYPTLSATDQERVIRAVLAEAPAPAADDRQAVRVS